MLNNTLLLMMKFLKDACVTILNVVSVSLVYVWFCFIDSVVQMARPNTVTMQYIDLFSHRIVQLPALEKL